MGRISRRIIRPITGLRGLTVLSVVLLHFSGPFTRLIPEAREFMQLSNRIVFRMDLFFMLSGFMAAYVFISLNERLSFRAYWEFLRARLIRLYPSYLATMLVLVTGVLLARARGLPIGGDYPFAALPIRLALLQAWPYVQCTWTWNYPTWFLSALWFAYLAVFPISWLLVQRLRGAKVTHVLVFAPLVVWMGAASVPGLAPFRMVVHASVEFLAGTALFVLFVDRSPFVAAAQKHLDKTVLYFATLLLAIAMVPIERLPQYVNALLVLSTPWLLAGVTGEVSISARLLATRPMLWLGKVSYALFVTHGVTQKLLKVVLPVERFAGSPAWVRYLVLAAYCAAVLLGAFLMYRLVEAPCASALKKWFAGSSPIRTRAPAASGERQPVSALDSAPVIPPRDPSAA